MIPTVYRCQLVKEWSTSEWLCREHIDARLVELNQYGLLIWGKIEVLGEIDGPCADCDRKRQEAPEYASPTFTFAFAPTLAESRMLTGDELAGIDMPKPLPLPQSAPPKRRAAGARQVL